MNLRNGSKRLHFLVLLLTAVGLVNLFSASAVDDHSHFTRQLLFDGVGLILYLAITYLLDYRLIARLSWLFWSLANLSLVAVLISGYAAGGSQRWLSLGSVRVQPSEFAKIAIIIFVANLLAKREAIIDKWRTFFYIVAVTAVPVVLILVEPDLGTAATVFLIATTMMLFHGIHKKIVLSVVIIGFLSAGAVWQWGLRPYQKSRVITLLNPEANPQGSGYQIIQSHIAVSSGGVLGKGYGKGMQTQGDFLPEQHSDFAFAVVAEEWGLVGALSVVFLLLLLLESVIRIATMARESLGTYIVVGAAAYMAIPIHINILMVLGLFPIVGLPLPFFTYGGTHMLVAYAALGLAHSVYVRRNIF